MLDKKKSITIDVPLVRKLISDQFPKWKDLSIKPVALGGWDNRTFHLGKKMLVRLPSANCYTDQVEKEHQHLPKLSQALPLSIPTPLGVGEPSKAYPWKWSIYSWISGEDAASTPIENLCVLSRELAQFLTTLYQIDPTNGPLPGSHNFHRGGALYTYDSQVRQALVILKDRVDTHLIAQVWEEALASTWSFPPVWIHGDISAGNLLIEKGKLKAVIDFGMMAIGDPACDLAIAWAFFKGESRRLFQQELSIDSDTWRRACGWALWKALIIAADFTSNPRGTVSPWTIIEDILEDRRLEEGKEI